MGNLTKAQLEGIVVQLRRVWMRRNEVVFEKRLTYPKKLLKFAREGLKDFQKAQKEHKPEAMFLGA